VEFRCEKDFGSRSIGLFDEIVDRSSAISFVLVPFGSCIVEGWLASRDVECGEGEITINMLFSVSMQRFRSAMESH